MKTAQTLSAAGCAATGRRVVIVGGVAGGMSAATRLRRLDEKARITVIERSGYVSYANCGLPYHVGQVIPDRRSLLLQSPRSLAARFGLDVRVHHEVTGIDRERQTVTVRNLATGETFEQGYDALVLSPGARPLQPPIEGIERALTLRTVEDADAVVAATAAARAAVVIGGGFIGVEMAENLSHRGLEVTLVETAEQVMTPLDPEMVSPVHDQMRLAGVRLHLGSAVSSIGERAVTLASGDIPFTSILTLGESGGKTHYSIVVLHKDAAGRRRHEEMGFHDGWNTCLDQLIDVVSRLRS